MARVRVSVGFSFGFVSSRVILPTPFSFAHFVQPISRKGSGWDNRCSMDDSVRPIMGAGYRYAYESGDVGYSFVTLL